MTYQSLRRSFVAVSVLIGFAVLFAHKAASAGGAVTPDPAVDDSLAASSSQKTVVLSGGCFWGIQLVFQNVEGVVSATSGYSGGAVKNPSYELVSTGSTGHAESVKIVYDPSKITYGRLLKVFFSVAHDPTELNRQGPDEGTQYRSIIFYSDESQQRIARAYIDQVDQAKVFPQKIVTEVIPLSAFYTAEAYHQNYAIRNPDQPYIMYNDLPKLDNLRKELPELYAKNK